MARVKLNNKIIKRTKNALQVADHFGVTILTVQHWKKKGCPFSAIPMPGENSTRIAVRYNLAELKKWRKKNMVVGRPFNGKS